jgi:hypothetical protein
MAARTPARHHQHLAGLADDAGGELRLAGQEPELAVEFAGAARPDEPFTALGAVDDLGASRQDDDEGGIRVADLEEHVSGRGHSELAKRPQLRDLLIAQRHGRLPPKIVESHRHAGTPWFSWSANPVRSRRGHVRRGVTVG